MSIAVGDRLSFMKAVASALPHERLIVGTGASALHDAVSLTAAAFELGFNAALVIPPFYYRDATDAGIVRFFQELFAAARPPSGGVVLYNFPRMSGMTFHATLVAELMHRFPETIAGMKDSSSDAELERAVHTTFPQLDILPGSEEQLLQTRRDGLAGCISGSVCLWPELAARAWTGDDEAATEVAGLRGGLQRPIIATVRARVAAEQHDEAWLRSVPPLE